jgi:hypothetical protein
MRTIAIVLAVSLILPSFAFPNQAPSKSSDWAALKSIPQEQDLLVHLKDGQKIKGKLKSLSDTNLELSVNGMQVDFKSADILRIYRLKGRRIAKGVLIGTAGGTGIGAVIGAATAKDGILGRGFDIAIMTGFGLVIGALSGLVIGANSRKKELVYEAPHVR